MSDTKAVTVDVQQAAMVALSVHQLLHKPEHEPLMTALAKVRTIDIALIDGLADAARAAWYTRHKLVEGSAAEVELAAEGPDDNVPRRVHRDVVRRRGGGGPKKQGIEIPLCLCGSSCFGSPIRTAHTAPGHSVLAADVDRDADALIRYSWLGRDRTALVRGIGRALAPH